MPNIVKHTYIKGRKIVQRALAHVDYIQYRPGEDRAPAENGSKKGSARTLYVSTLEDIEHPHRMAREFRKSLSDKDERGNVVHKFILSPSESGVDMNKFTKEVMEQIGRHKGQDLKYAWVIHDNTDHRHSHVVVLGLDLAGDTVRFNKTDYAYMREFGDRYLEREHGIHRSEKYDERVEMLARTSNYNLYMHDRPANIEFLTRERRAQSWRTDEDFAHLLRINANWNESLFSPSSEGGLDMGSTWMHDRGRLSAIHDLFNNSAETDKWNDILNYSTDAELREIAQKQLDSLIDQRHIAVDELGEQLNLDTPEKIDAFFAGLKDQFANEYRAIDQVLFPERYEPADNGRNAAIDLNLVKAEDKIDLSNGKTITKFDSADSLEEIRLGLKAGDYQRISEDKYSALCGWIGKKQLYGDEYYGPPPLKQLEKEIDASLDLDELAKDAPLSLDDLSDSMSDESIRMQDLLGEQGTITYGHSGSNDKLDGSFSLLPNAERQLFDYLEQGGDPNEFTKHLGIDSYLYDPAKELGAKDHEIISDFSTTEFDKTLGEHDKGGDHDPLKDGTLPDNSVVGGDDSSGNDDQTKLDGSLTRRDDSERKDDDERKSQHEL